MPASKVFASIMLHTEGLYRKAVSAIYKYGKFYHLSFLQHGDNSSTVFSPAELDFTCSETLAAVQLNLPCDLTAGVLISRGSCSMTGLLCV